jgi:hypothetical protein
MLGDIDKVLAQIEPGQLVLDVGGWACPFNRADWVIDSEPYESRGFYEKIGLPKSQGGEEEYFNKSTWVQRDICDKEPWPFKDKQFDFSICSHILEDIRDPLYVCSELVRVSKRGYIEVPSRLFESCRGQEQKNMAGLSHHRWLVDIKENHLQFTMKFHTMHGDFRLSLPSSFARKLPLTATYSYLFWDDSFNFTETQFRGAEEIHEDLRLFVAKHYQYPRYRFAAEVVNSYLHRGLNGVRRRLGK